MDLISKIEDLKNFGIDLKLESKEAEIFYVRSLKLFFDDKDSLYCTMISDHEIQVADDYETLAAITIDDSTLRIHPLGENPYAVLMDVLEFVANFHKPTVALFNEMKSVPSTPPVDEEEESDEDSSDEWI